jgi:hypothetical protein
LVRYLAIVCVLLQCKIAYLGYTECLIMPPQQMREICGSLCSAVPDPEPEESASCCGMQTCPKEADTPKGCGGQALPTSEPCNQATPCDATKTDRQVCETEGGKTQCCLAVCSYLAGIPLQKVFATPDYSCLAGINNFSGDIAVRTSYISFQPLTIRSIHPSISTTVLRI